MTREKQDLAYTNVHIELYCEFLNGFLAGRGVGSDFSFHPDYRPDGCVIVLFKNN